MAKIDWLKHCKAFLKKHEDTVAERKAYCDLKRLNYNSFRPKLAEYKKSQAYKNSLSQQSIERQLKKSVSKKTNATSGSVDEKEGRRARDLSNDEDDVKKTYEVTPGGCRSFVKGNTASLLHGKYAKKVFLNDECKELANGSFDDLLMLFKQQFHLMNIQAISRLQEIEELYDAGDCVKKTTVSIDGSVIETPITKAQAVDEVLSNSAAALSEMMKVANAAEKTVVDREIKFMQMSTTSQQDKERTLKELILLKAKEKWSVFDFVEQCAMRSVEPPVWAIKQLEHELRTAEPEIDTSGGVTPEQARELREESIRRRAGRKERLAVIQERNAQIYAGAADLGKEKETVAEDLEGSSGG